MPIWLKWGLIGKDEGETCPAELGWGKYALGVWRRLVRLAINDSVKAEI